MGSDRHGVLFPRLPRPAGRRENSLRPANGRGAALRQLPPKAPVFPSSARGARLTAGLTPFPPSRLWTESCGENRSNPVASRCSEPGLSGRLRKRRETGFGRGGKAALFEGGVYGQRGCPSPEFAAAPARAPDRDRAREARTAPAPNAVLKTLSTPHTISRSLRTQLQ